MSDLNIREEKIQSQRKQTERNEFVREICSWFPLILYKNNGMTSKFPVNDRTENIRKASEFEKTRDSLTTTGYEYNQNQSFLSQYAQLFKSIGLSNVVDFGGNENCEFAECVQSSKNVYLSFVTILGCENVLYSFSVKDNSVNVLNSVMVLGSSNNVYYSAGVKSGYNIFFSKYIYDSADMRFSTNMHNCQECILCDSLENASYCIRNVQLEKEEYAKQKKEILKDKGQFSVWYNNILSVPSKNIACSDSEGSFLLNCENVKNGHMSFNVKNANNIIMAFSNEVNENYGDILCAGRSIDMYGGIVTGTFSSKVYNSMMISNSSNIFYSYGLNDCSYCIGCVGLKNKQFCILNKEYPKEQRFEVANTIFENMESEGTLGQFFPGSMNPFYFNDTVASLIKDFTKEEIVNQGYLRRDEEIKVDIPQGVDVLSIKSLAQYQGFDATGERKINPEILKKIIKDEKGNYYKIVPMELEFLQKHGLPLPEIHRLERIKLGFKFK